LEISRKKHEVKINGEVMDLPPKELELLYHLAVNYNQVFTRDQLLDNIWGFEYVGDSRTVDVHIKRLREKLENKSKEKGFTIIPTLLFVDERGFAKLEIALCKGKHSYDKRESIKLKDNKRELDRALKY
jgi:DNA-binding winged helix-turn-helix (wHTH) protein